MPATPAWPPASTPRLYVEQPLEGSGEIMITGTQAHDLTAVMRAKAGDPIRLFDDVSGEWLAKVEHLGKRVLRRRRLLAAFRMVGAARLVDQHCDRELQVAALVRRHGVRIQRRLVEQAPDRLQHAASP